MYILKGVAQDLPTFVYGTVAQREDDPQGSRSTRRSLPRPTVPGKSVCCAGFRQRYTKHDYPYIQQCSFGKMGRQNYVVVARAAGPRGQRC